MHVLISQQHQWGKVQTKVSLGQPRQDKARVKESRYVIKVMRDENRGGLEIPWFVRTKGCTAPFNWLIKTTVLLL